MKTYISVNVVSQALILIDCIKKNKCYTQSFMHQMKLPFGVCLDVSLSFAKQCGWITINNGIIEFSKSGLVIAEMFNGYAISQKLWKMILSEYITVCQPAWAKRIPYGRREAYYFMTEEEQRCFDEAGLIDSQNDSVVRWWDSLAELIRIKKSAIMDDIGRQGERLTLIYEERRTGSKPEWVAIETNVSGYDIISQLSPSSKSQILIEVKSSSQQIQDAYAFISRHEWDVATLANNQERYFFYFWLIGDFKKQLAILSVHEMKHYIPYDNDIGKWENARIPFEAFTSIFIDV